jgi:hypothetical protein
MRDRPRGVAVARYIDIRMSSYGVRAARAQFIYVPFFICTKSLEYFK